MIPVEAVEAVSDEAFKAASDTYMEVLTDLRLKEGGGFKVASQNRRALRAAIQAAAPHMLKAVWDEAYGKGFEAAAPHMLDVMANRETKAGELAAEYRRGYRDGLADRKQVTK